MSSTKKKSKAIAERRRRASRTRWNQPEWKDEKKRSEFGSYIQSFRKEKKGGRPRSRGPRCPCGAMTLQRAIARAHHCTATEAA